MHRSTSLLVFGALLCAFVTVIHVIDQGGLTGMADPPYKGYLFYALEIGGVFAAILLLTPRAASAGWVLALVVAVGPVSGYTLSRSIGLPGYSDDIGNWFEPLGVASLVVEGLLFICALTALTADHRVFAAELRSLGRDAPRRRHSEGPAPSADRLFDTATTRTSARPHPSPSAGGERQSPPVPEQRVEPTDNHQQHPEQGKSLVAEAAWVVRHHPGDEQLATLEHAARAHAVGLLLDTLRLNWVDLPEQVRHQTLNTCRELTGERAKSAE